MQRVRIAKIPLAGRILPKKFSALCLLSALAIGFDAAAAGNIDLRLYQGPSANNGATPWYAQGLTMGTPQQSGNPDNFRWFVDTGTTNNWLTSTKCTTSACSQHNKFDESASSTFNLIQSNINISWGPWGNMIADLGTDDITLTDVVTSSSVTIDTWPTYFGTNYDGYNFYYLVEDGGVAIPSQLADPNMETVLGQLQQAGEIDYQIASFWYDYQAPLPTGMVRFGGLDPSKFTGPLNKLDLLPPANVSFPMLWTVNLEQLDVGGSVLQTNIDFILDTGSDIFKGPDTIINGILNTIGQYGPTTVIGSIPDFSSYPDITLVMNGQAYVVKPEDYFLADQSTIPTTYRVGAAPLAGLDTLLVGTVFLQTVYSAFDVDNQAVYLATPVSTASGAFAAPVWENTYGSNMKIMADHNGRLAGCYASTTGSSGAYHITGSWSNDAIGVEPYELAIAIPWRSYEAGAGDTSWHWTSAMSGFGTGSSELKLLNSLNATTVYPGLNVTTGIYPEELTFTPYGQGWSCPPMGPPVQQTQTPLDGTWVTADDAVSIEFEESGFDGFFIGTYSDSTGSYEIEGYYDYDTSTPTPAATEAAITFIIPNGAPGQVAAVGSFLPVADVMTIQNFANYTSQGSVAENTLSNRILGPLRLFKQP